MLIAIIIGAALIGLGAWLLWMKKRADAQLLEIRFMKSMPIPELVETYGAVAGEVGTGGFSQLVETSGRVVADEPLKGELSGADCAYYRMQVEERYEEEYWEKDSEGRDIRRTRTGSNTVASNTRSARFFVEDAGARVPVNPDGAKLDLVSTVDRFEPANTYPGAISFGGFSLNLAGGMPAGRRVLGYHYSESILPLDARLYAIGQACDTCGELTFQAPDDKSKPYILSTKSEEEVTRGMESKSRWLMIGAIASIAIGVGAIVFGIVRR